MKVAVVAPLVTPLRPTATGGSQAFLVDLARGLKRRGHDVLVYCAAPSDVPGVELVQVLARAHQVPLQAVRATIRGTLDPSKPVRADVTLFNAVQLDFFLKGVTDAQGQQLIESFKRR